jgi:hypothetical protein
VYSNVGNGTLAAKVDYPTLTSPLFVTAGDVNGDGRADIAVAQNGFSSIRIFVGDGAAFLTRFDVSSGAASTSSGPFAVTIADFDGDGDSDLGTLNNSQSTMSVIRNTSTNPLP